MLTYIQQVCAVGDEVTRVVRMAIYTSNGLLTWMPDPDGPLPEDELPPAWLDNIPMLTEYIADTGDMTDIYPFKISGTYHDITVDVIDDKCRQWQFDFFDMCLESRAKIADLLNECIQDAPPLP